jgi:tungstate transport system substrate-binding protein
MKTDEPRRHARRVGRGAATWVLAVSCALAACGRETRSLVLATTTSVSNSGLLDHLLPAYERPVRVSAVGSGLALQLLATGEADVAITHAPDRETQALQQHPGWRYRKVFWNEFVLVGPPDAVTAMRRIAASTARFISRGDDSGTYEREQQLWGRAGVRPAGNRLVVAGASMGQTLRIAGSDEAYTLTDEGTFLALSGSVALKVLYRGDPTLLNTYAVVSDPARADGMRFAGWVADGAGRDRLRDVMARGAVRGFHLWPEGAPRDRPDALPR